MSAFLSIRGNLLLINLVVVGLILWLTISFLHLAASQRVEALLLQNSMRVQRSISLASSALASERSYIQSSLSSSSGISAEQNQQLISLAQTTDSLFNDMTGLTNELMNSQKFVSMIPVTRSALSNQLATVIELHDQLTTQRPVQRTAPASDTLSELQTNILVALAELAISVKFLPDFNASEIANYHALLNELLMINTDLLHKKNFTIGLFKSYRDERSETGTKTAVLNEKIEERIANVVKLSQANKSVDQLHLLALRVQNHYLRSYRSLEETVGINATSSPQVVTTQSDWLLMNTKLTELISELTDKTHESINVLATRLAKRATNNFYIDVFLVILCFIITFATVLINRRIKQYAYHDSLTQLANRLNFELTLKNTTVSGLQSYAVIYFDLDRFKAINDNYGHTIGDSVLIEVASRLKSVCKSSDLAARLGGDEFAVLITDAKSEADVEALAARMVETVEQVIHVQNINLKVGVSAGVCIAPQDCAGGLELLRNADIAMYHMKSTKQGGVFRFNPSIAEAYQQRLILEQDLKQGLEEKQFHVVYQPKVCTSSGHVKSVEALLRWTHPTRGSISPGQFIPVAEDIGLMGLIGYWVLQEACREIALLQKSGLPDLQVAVNISPQQFGDEHFVDRVCSEIETHGLSYSSLTLEVTESIVMQDIDRVISMLKTLQQLGIDIAVDDFGTGYSSLQYLQELPLNTLKIDRAFILALENSDDAQRSVANSIVQLASLFNLETVAEGIETIEQEIQIRSLGVNYIQGYRYSKPVSAAELPDTIASITLKHAATDWDQYDQVA